MILGVVGTHPAPMVQLVSSLDAFASAHQEERVVIQAGPLAGTTTFATTMGQIDPLKLHELARQARILVTHGGPTLLLEAVDRGQVPVVMPRERHRGEHVDNHQLEFAWFLAERGLVLLARDATSLLKCLEHYGELVAAMHPTPLPPASPAEAARRIGALLSR